MVPLPLDLPPIKLSKALSIASSRRASGASSVGVLSASGFSTWEGPGESGFEGRGDPLGVVGVGLETADSGAGLGVTVDSGAGLGLVGDRDRARSCLQSVYGNIPASDRRQLKGVGDNTSNGRHIGSISQAELTSTARLSLSSTLEDLFFQLLVAVFVLLVPLHTEFPHAPQEIIDVLGVILRRSHGAREAGGSRREPLQ